MIAAMFFAGFFTGSRTFTPITVLCWFSWLAGYSLDHTWAAWTARPFTVLVLTLCALAEYIYDVCPIACSRKLFGPFLARLCFGALSGAVVAQAYTEPRIGGVLFGLFGSAVGTLVFFALRQRLALRLGRDLPIGLLESAFSLLLMIATAWHVRTGVVWIQTIWGHMG
ncbi:MAG: hypothetical protein PW735_09220 [Acidobacteriaceae bacterium]|nr:hypothetical protein [Acidobacteriaceae bacterium]